MTDYDPATTVWIQNIGTAHRVAKQIEVGICWINDWFLREPRTAFGCAKASGIGREGGVFTELRNVCIKLGRSVLDALDVTDRGGQTVTATRRKSMLDR